MVPVNLQDQLVPGSFEFAIHYLVDNAVDFSGFEARFRNDEEGRPGYDPRLLLKVVLLGYSRGVIHSRKLERACCENVTFMALACHACGRQAARRLTIAPSPILSRQCRI